MLFKEWLNKKEEYEFVFELFLTTIYAKNLYLHYGFLNIIQDIIQALEVYHSNKYKNSKYQKTEIWKEGLLKKLLDVVNEFPSKSTDSKYGISDDFRDALKGKLQGKNRYTLQTRLGEILKDITYLLPDNFIGDEGTRKDFIKRAAKTPNALTHYNKKEREKTAKREELYQLFDTLTLILQCCLLRELDLTDESIKKLIARHRSYRREWHSS